MLFVDGRLALVHHHEAVVDNTLLLSVWPRLGYLERWRNGLVRNLGRTNWRGHVNRLDRLKVVRSATSDADV